MYDLLIQVLMPLYPGSGIFLQMARHTIIPRVGLVPDYSLIYAGKTQTKMPCSSVLKVPNGWCITHSPNHWSIKETMLQFIEKALSPFMEKQRESLQLPLDQAGLTILIRL